MSSASQIYQLKVRLLGLSPMIWRRVLVSDSTTLRELHGILQVAMGWEDTSSFILRRQSHRPDAGAQGRQD